LNNQIQKQNPTFCALILRNKHHLLSDFFFQVWEATDQPQRNYCASVSARPVRIIKEQIQKAKQ
jgi:hypothetical protein